MKMNIKRRKVVELDLNYNYVTTYANQTECAKSKGIYQSQISNYLSGKCKPKKYILVYEDVYNELYKNKDDKCVVEKEELKDIVKQKDNEYYINVLVGLANGTLVEGASYEVDGTVFVYSKDKKALMIGNSPMITFDNMWRKVNIELPLLTPSEREFLMNLLKAFTNVKGIQKNKDRREGYEYIGIVTSNEEDGIVLPSFKEGKYYKNLKQNILYSLKDLNLEVKENVQ